MDTYLTSPEWDRSAMERTVKSTAGSKSSSEVAVADEEAEEEDAFRWTVQRGSKMAACFFCSSIVDVDISAAFSLRPVIFSS